jgi:hypothetical protein
MKTAMLGETLYPLPSSLYSVVCTEGSVKYLPCKILHCNQEQIGQNRPHKRNAQYVLKKNHCDAPKKINESKLKTNSIIVNSFCNI